MNIELNRTITETIPGLSTGLLLLLSVGNGIDQTSAIYWLLKDKQNITYFTMDIFSNM